MFAFQRLGLSFIALIAVSIFASSLSAQVWHTDYQNLPSTNRAPMWSYYGINPYSRTYPSRSYPRCQRMQTQVALNYPSAYVVPAHATSGSVAYSAATFSTLPVHSRTEIGVSQSTAQTYVNQSQPITQDNGSVGVLVPDTGEVEYGMPSVIESNEVIGEVIRSDDTIELTESEIEEAQHSLNDLPIEPPAEAELSDPGIAENSTVDIEKDRLRKELSEARAEARALEQRARNAERQLKKLKKDEQ